MPPKKALLLNSYSYDQKWTRSITEAVSKSLDEAGISLVVEFMDTKRHSNPEHYSNLLKTYQRKFSNTQFDIVLTSDDNAVNFALKNRDVLFPGVPIVFCGVNNIKLPERDDFVNITGALEVPGSVDMIELLLKLHPSLKHLYLIMEFTSTGKSNYEIINKNLQKYSDRFESTWLAGLSEDELAKQLSGLGDDSAVILVSFFPDREGGTFTFSEGANFVSKVCARPVYSLWDYFLGEGIVGGMLTSGKYQGLAAAGMALRIMNGDALESIPVIADTANHFMFDYNQLNRFNIKLESLPADSVIINQPSNILRKYQLQLTAAGAVIVLLVVICIALAVSVRARRKAEKDLANSNIDLEDLVKVRNMELDLLREAEAAASGSEARFRSLFDSSPLSLWEEDFSGLIPIFNEVKERGVDDLYTYFNSNRDELLRCLVALRIINVNKASVELFGAESQEHLVQNLPSTFAKESWTLFAGAVAALAGGAQSYFSEGIMRSLSGEYIDVLFYVQVVIGNEKLLKKVLITCVDITEKKKLEEAIVQTEKMISVGGLAAGMAHEVNNPLAGILQGAQNLHRRFSPDLPANIEAAKAAGVPFEKIVTYLESRNIFKTLDGISASGERAAQIVRNMLNFSRQSSSSACSCDMNELLDTALELASSDYDLKKNYDFKKIEIVKKYDPKAKYSWCVPSELEQVFLNLFKNAAQAMADISDTRGVLTLSTKVQNNYVVIEVGDNGPGLDEELRKRVFEPFFTTKSPEMGSGLGLSVSYFIITQNHGGSFSVDPCPGQGACFTIKLPLKDA
ncbi:sensor histidine kinase [Maridesulfovibrio frigidus]|uniref:sensor histidine kinase n=1 Tax=Maridesulfovibrio frigidus TaxID=340956 RepID=UPI00146F9B28|nr:ATP-binding protein [Maridesulfovibrio frigidus]